MALSSSSLPSARAQIHAEEYLLDPVIHALVTQAAVKSRPARAHHPRAAQITPETVLLTAAVILMRYDESHLCSPLQFGLTFCITEEGQQRTKQRVSPL